MRLSLNKSRSIAHSLLKQVVWHPLQRLGKRSSAKVHTSPAGSGTIHLLSLPILIHHNPRGDGDVEGVDVAVHRDADLSVALGGDVGGEAVALAAQEDGGLAAGGAFNRGTNRGTVRRGTAGFFPGR